MAYKQKSGSPFHRNFGIGKSPLENLEVKQGDRSYGTGEKAQQMGLDMETINKKKEAWNADAANKDDPKWPMKITPVEYTDDTKKGETDATDRMDFFQKGYGVNEEDIRNDAQRKLIEESMLADSTIIGGEENVVSKAKSADPQNTRYEMLKNARKKGE
jgi:hypothetical protein